MNPEISSFADINRLLNSWSGATKRFSHGLEQMYELLDRLGNPQQRLRVVHVAGTSGKTSTAYYIAALLGASGKKVGLTVSPHIDEVNERVQINLRPMPEPEFCRRFAEYLQVVATCRLKPNYFELLMAFALWEFAAQKVDYAVIEVGIGGLLDSSNVFDDPQKVCVITDIGYDHTGILGDTLPEIAGQKAGIIQLHNAVFCNRQGEEVMTVIVEQSQKMQADLNIMTSSGLDEKFDFLPLFQRRNLGLSLAAAKFVAERDHLPDWDDEAIVKAAHTHVPARMETLSLGNKTLILDIAHNGQKLHSLLESVKDKHPGQAIAALIRMPAREPSMRRTTESLNQAVRGVQHIIMTSLAEEGDPQDDSFDQQRLVDVFHQSGYQSFEFIADPAAAFEVLRQRSEPILLVTGSTYLLNHIRPLLKQ
jgi:dihydrofolate synthase/folylpolyglutamate synthase